MEHPKNIALFIDGTWNQPGKADTNVRKLFLACPFNADGPRRQASYYLPGVGTDIRQSHAGVPVGVFGIDDRFRADVGPEIHPLLLLFRKRLGGYFGAGTAARIKEAYAFLSSQFVRERGDKVFVFGFSRGAFAARSLAGFVSRVGTLLMDRLDLVEEAYTLYEAGTDPTDSALADYLRRFADARMVRSIEDAGALPIHFLGVWDTVGAMGLPGRLRRLTAARTERHQIALPPTVMVARHALALHEMRAVFNPMPWTGAGRGDLQQVWFPGAHADVGGGYPAGESGLSDAALRWMVHEAMAIGLHLDPAADWLADGASPRILHHELRRIFALAEPAPRRLLLALLAPEDDPTRPLGHAMYCHRSLLDHLRSRAGQRYDFALQRTNDCLAAIDELGLQLAVRSRLLGLCPDD